MYLEHVGRKISRRCLRFCFFIIFVSSGAVFKSYGISETCFLFVRLFSRNSILILNKWIFTFARF